ncbi:MAG TPA: hypothetical protein VNW15_09585 [Rhizomicrobium sp.]|nr:hypothetical protein [Rhizomicrobium sp.]
MMNRGVRAKLLEAARSLRSIGVDQLSIATLCKKTGLGRTKIRQYFPTNGAINTATQKEELIEEENPYQKTKPETWTTEEDWLDRRLRICERAISIPEAITEEAAGEQSNALLLLEETLSNRTGVSLKFAELPLIAEAAPSAVPDPENKCPIQDPYSHLQPDFSAGPDSEIYQSHAGFQARELMPDSSEKSHSAERDIANAKPVENIRAFPWAWISSAAAVAILALCASLIWPAYYDHTKQMPVPQPSRGLSPTSSVIVIDASGAVPEQKLIRSP